MHRASILMVRCPKTGHELSTGVEMAAATFAQLPDIASRVRCPACGHDHVLSTRDAWLGDPAPSVPEFTWLFINNRNLPND
jgi:hypothetical protein